MRRFFLMLPLVLLPGFATLAQDTGSQLDSIFASMAADLQFNGVVLVAEGEEVLFENGYGLANREWEIPNTPETRFDIASISKQFTAALVLQLEAEGKLNLQDPLAKHLPWYRQDVGRQVTLFHLLTHRSGIPNYTSLPGVWQDSLRNHYRLPELIEKFCSGDPEFLPGSQYSYNNSGYVLLAAVIESVTGKKFEQVIRQRLLEPAGMRDSGVDSREEIILRRAGGYAVSAGKYQNANYTYMQNLAGAGNMYATAADLHRWDMALRQNKVLKPYSIEKMQKAVSFGNNWITPWKNGYGLGVGLAKAQVDEGGKKQVVFHSGHISGFSGFFCRLPERGQVVVLLSNTGSVGTPEMYHYCLKALRVLNQPRKGTTGK